MKAEWLLAIGLVWFGVGLPPSLGADLQMPPDIVTESEPAGLAPIVSLSEYEKTAPKRLWASYRNESNPESAGLDAASDVDLSFQDEVIYQPPQATAPPGNPFGDEPADEPSAAGSAAPADDGELLPDVHISPPEPDSSEPLDAIPTPPLGVGNAWMELACGKSCLDDSSCQTCCLPHWRTFGDFLMLRPTNAEVAYAETVNGPIVQPPAVPLQISPIATAEPDFEPGVRVGISRVFADCSNITLSYSHLETDTFSSVSAQPPFVIRSLVRHPGDQTAAIDNLFASARYDISFQMVDLDFRDVWTSCPWYSINYVLGVRYTHLKQDFDSSFRSLGTERVSTALDFDGGGLRVGLEGERRLGCTGLSVYGRGVANFLGGEFSGTYLQSNTFAGTVVDTAWKAQRIVSILDLEAGVQYTCCNDCVSVSAGYAFSGWYNAVTTQDFIGAVKTNNFDDLTNILGFDGFVVRAEVRF